MNNEYMSFRTQKEIERAVTHPDLDYELYRAKKYRWVIDPRTGFPVPIKIISDAVANLSMIRGSGLTGTWNELIYANITSGTAKNTFTSEFQINDVTGMGAAPVLPAYFFFPGTSQLGKTIRIVCRILQLGTGSTPPTWQLNLRLNPVVTPANPPTGPIVAGMISGMTGTTTASTIMEAEADVQFTVAGAPGNNSTLRGIGMIVSPTGFVSPFAAHLLGGGASPGTVTTFDYSLLNTLTVGMICGTSLAANQVTLLQLLIFGLN